MKLRQARKVARTLTFIGGHVYSIYRHSTATRAFVRVMKRLRRRTSYIVWIDEAKYIGEP